MKDKKVFIAIIVVLVLSITGTLAYFTGVVSVDNLFTAGTFNVELIETFSSPNNWMPGDEIVKEVSAKNNGTVQARVRIKLVETWEDEYGNFLPLVQDGNSAALIHFANPEDWEKVGVYYYYKYDLDPNDTTSTFIDKVTFNPVFESISYCRTNDSGVKICSGDESDYQNARYTLKVIADFVQADMYEEVWNTDYEVDYFINPVQVEPTEKKVTYERMIMTNDEQKELNTDGAASQWPVSFESSSTGDLMLFGIDVAGMYKSTDHGANWVMANSGMESRGVGMFAIDPNNSNHVLALGIGSAGGMHISYDKANTWEKTFTFVTNGARYLWDGLEFDPTSYDSVTNLTTDVYFSTPYARDTAIRNSPSTEPTSRTSLDDDEVGLYKSSDGGETFSLIINDERLADGIIKITNDGSVYVGNQYGLFLIDKENYSILATYLANDPEIDYSKGITGLDVVNNTIYAQTWDGIYTLSNGTLTKITNSNYINTWPQFLEVSKTNPNHMIYEVRADVNNYYVSRAVVSFDGGSTWEYSSAERNSLFFKSNWEGREKIFIIDPSNDNNVLTFGSDNVVRSVDGGLNFKQANGISNLMQGGRFNFNYYDPDLLLFSAQDYTGVISFDGGETYRELIIPSKSNFYGGFAADKDTLFGFAHTTWNGGTLTYSHDGGSTWVDTGLTVSGVSSASNYSSLQSPSNPNALFAAEYYSLDKGYTWSKMDGCVNVFTFNYVGDRELYGTDANGNIVVSYDDGVSWTMVSNENFNKSERLNKQSIIDMAYDFVNNYVYVVVQSIIRDGSNSSVTYTVEEVYKYDVENNESTKLDIPFDNTRGRMRLKSVAIDPNSTSVVYVGGAGEYFSSSTGLIRSIDGGETWKVLTTSNNPNYPAYANNQGGYEVATVRVNPYDGRVWISSGCYGYETFDPPYSSNSLNHSKEIEHKIIYMYNDQKVNELTLNNNEKNTYIYEEDGKTFVSWYKDKELTEEFPIGSNVYKSMTLYAKLNKSVKVKFFDRNKLLWKIDLDDYDKGDITQIPTRTGYAFAGWYLDSALTTKADFSQIRSNTSVYAGWYKVIDNIFDINKKDMATSINYTNYKIQEAIEVDNNANENERSIYTTVDKNSTYLITFRMDNRFRLGMTSTSFWRYNAVLDPYIDPLDVDGTNPVNEYVYRVIETNNYTKLLIHYYSWTGSSDFMDIKNTFKIYKIENTNVQNNNDIIDELDYEITSGANQIYTINEDTSASFSSSGDMSNFAYVDVDGMTVASSNYSLDSVSNTITFNKQFMDTLAPNKEHTLDIVYTNGADVTTKFIVQIAR